MCKDLLTGTRLCVFKEQNSRSCTASGYGVTPPAAVLTMSVCHAAICSTAYVQTPNQTACLCALITSCASPLLHTLHTTPQQVHRLRTLLL